MDRRAAFTIVDLLATTLLVAVCAAFWRAGEYYGWNAVVITVTAFAYYVNRYRLPFELPTSLVLFPLVLMSLFVFALMLGMHHPPWMAPPDWQWPPFSSMMERMAHAFALSMWGVFWGVPVLMLCDTVRHAVEFVGWLLKQVGDSQDDEGRAA